ncbi:MAG: rRNA maturation RNase YbeY [Xylanivirga thermophila]|jgi:probable rRNA maturation factor|nr:rRNA maturation RNase YbeY [Xylanivirga thermophila]
MLVEIDNRQDKVEYSEDIEMVLKKCVEKTLNVENFNFPAEVSITLVDDGTIHQINKEYRDIDRPTDVLSFPLLSFAYCDKAEVSMDDVKYEINPETNAVVLGDVVISLERAQNQANEYGHSFIREVGFLTVHSMLHLLGYDHEEDDERDRMRKREEEILDKLEITR